MLPTAWDFPTAIISAVSSSVTAVFLRRSIGKRGGEERGFLLVFISGSFRIVEFSEFGDGGSVPVDPFANEFCWCSGNQRVQLLKFSCDETGGSDNGIRGNDRVFQESDMPADPDMIANGDTAWLTVCNFSRFLFIDRMSVTGENIDIVGEHAVFSDPDGRVLFVECVDRHAGDGGLFSDCQRQVAGSDNIQVPDFEPSACTPDNAFGIVVQNDFRIFKSDRCINSHFAVDSVKSDFQARNSRIPFHFSVWQNQFIRVAVGRDSEEIANVFFPSLDGLFAEHGADSLKTAVWIHCCPVKITGVDC